MAAVVSRNRTVVASGALESGRCGPSVSTITAAVIFTGAVIFLAVVIFAAGVFSAVGARVSAQPSPPPGVQTFTGLSRDHVQGPVHYAQNPPVGGPHNPVFLNCGVYSSPVPNENAVHSMEHGAVWITYRPDLPAADVATLRNLVGDDTYVILSPYAGLPAPVVASAWGVQMKADRASDPRLAQFLDYYRQGPQTPEPGAACSGGTGTPEQSAPPQ